MKTTRRASNLARGLAALLCIGLFLAAPARAAVYTGIWDPQFGSPFAQALGWRGDATFFVPDSCRPTGSGTVSNDPACGGAAAVTQAQVELYDTGSNALLATLTFDAASITVDQLAFIDGALVAIGSQLSSYATPLVEPGINLGDYLVAPGTEFALQFSLGLGPQLGWQDCSNEGQGCLSGFNDSQNFAPRFTLTQVDEPASLALAGLSLALLALTARRRRHPA